MLAHRDLSLGQLSFLAMYVDTYNKARRLKMQRGLSPAHAPAKLKPK
jgi:hypothetical protein